MLKNENILKTKCKSLNNVLGGGLYQKVAYLIYGAGKTGKTQLMHQLCVDYLTKQFANKTAPCKKVIFFDTEGTFRPERITEMVQLFNLNSQKILKQILVSEILSNSALLSSLENLEQSINTNNIGLIIIDSLNNHFRSESSSKEISFNQSKTKFLSILDRITDYINKKRIYLACTAQITESFVQGKVIQEIPFANQYLNSYFTEYLYLSHYRENKYYAHLVDSSFFREKRVMFQLTEKGLEDYKI
ncbi:MAG: AAA family ATPase [Candidatus Lokiarchaeota archaeon]